MMERGRSGQQKKVASRVRPSSMVCSLAKSWQCWVAENEKKRDSEPSGWSPCSTEQEGSGGTGRRSWAGRHTDTAQAGEPSESRIRSGQVTKSVTSRVQDKGRDIQLLTKKYEEDQSDPRPSPLGNTTPTRRRKCTNLVSQLTQGWKEMEKENQLTAGHSGGTRSSSVDTEDSGFLEGDEKNQQGPEKEEKQEQQQVEEEAPCPRIKRPSAVAVNRDVEEAKKISLVTKKYSPVTNLKSKWQNWAEEHVVTQKLNPFSEEFDYEMSMATRLRKGDEGYGRPKEGSKTAERARRAEAHIHREISDMCFIIRTLVDPDPDGKTRVTFAQLFDRYVRISDKVVGILMRARKHGKLHFEGEMLWQGRDDDVIITLLV
ncbi:actin binding Rho activating protein b [Polypterus senegalus]